MSLIKNSIVFIGRIINAERHNEQEPTEPLDIEVTDENNEILGVIRGRITLIRIALSPNVFGANVIIQIIIFMYQLEKEM